jgi:pyruvate dehydrogenase E2 component (dihydrolipoamide acetyltransferase)
MTIEITMPRLSDTMETGTVIHWYVKKGDTVSAGDVVADVETDKATMEMQAFDDGTVSEILVEEGHQVNVGTPIAILAEDDEITDASPEGTVAEDEQVEAQSGGMKVSPVARRLADEYDIDPQSLNGSGPGGRVIKRDVLAAVQPTGETVSAAQTIREAQVEQFSAQPPSAAQPLVPAGPWRGDRTEPLSSTRQTIARRLVESKQTIPHYQVSMTFAMDDLLALRSTLNEQLRTINVKLSVNDFIVRCCALAMAEHPAVNGSFGGQTIIYHGAVNIGIAIALPEERGGGLVVATIRDADQKSLRAISIESAHFAEKARSRGLSMEDMADSTFTVSNLGMYGVDSFNAIINPPNSAILAVGSAMEKPVVRDGELVVGYEMSATMSLDHRVIDGAMAARYMKTLKDLMENPAALLV